jgi:hypothetical protein
VALVLAIAALIFLVVFLAVPALQRNQRDDGRRRDIASIVNAATTYYSNMNTWWATNETAYSMAVDGKITKGATFGKYIDTLSNGISTVLAKTVQNSVPTTWTPSSETEIVVWPGLTCGTAPGLAPVKGSGRTAAVIGKLESGSSTYCQSVN